MYKRYSINTIFYLNHKYLDVLFKLWKQKKIKEFIKVYVYSNNIFPRDSIELSLSK